MHSLCSMVGTGWRGHWLWKSLLIGGVSSAIDLGLLLTTRSVGFPTAACAATGVGIGAAANFLLNRHFSFKAKGTPFWPAAARFASGMAILTSIHAACVGMMVDRFQIPLLLAKYGADAAILAGGNLLLLRYVVFARRTPVPAAVASSWNAGFPKRSAQPS